MINNIKLFVDLIVSSTNEEETFNVLNIIRLKNIKDKELIGEINATEGANTRVYLTNGFCDVNQTVSEIKDLLADKQIL